MFKRVVHVCVYASMYMHAYGMYMSLCARTGAVKSFVHLCMMHGIAYVVSTERGRHNMNMHTCMNVHTYTRMDICKRDCAHTST